MATAPATGTVAPLPSESEARVARAFAAIASASSLQAFIDAVATHAGALTTEEERAGLALRLAQLPRQELNVFATLTRDVIEMTDLAQNASPPSSPSPSSAPAGADA